MKIEIDPNTKPQYKCKKCNRIVRKTATKYRRIPEYNIFGEIIGSKIICSECIKYYRAVVWYKGYHFIPLPKFQKQPFTAIAQLIKNGKL